MKTVVLGDQKAWIEDAPDPTPEGEWIVVKVTVSPICGSDMHAYRAPGEHRGQGHEGVGEVVAAEAGSRRNVGDRVLINPVSGCGDCRACRSGYYIHCVCKPAGSGGHFAQFVRKQDWLCPLLPDDLPDDLASLMGCGLSPAYQALTRMQVSAFHTVLITGLGPVGLGATALACFLGARVIVSDLEPWRRERALELGAEIALDPVDGDMLEALRDLTGGQGVDRALDASGSAVAERLCIDALGTLGKVGFIGENQGKIEFGPSSDGIRRGMEIITAWHQPLSAIDDLLVFLRRFPAAGKLISHSFGFTRVSDAFAAMASGRSAKVLLLPWE